ncbi:hypothetical protein DL768_009353 [Monosporascus sp. mg162]|nr:hypothetical protein DL768_009353 [Monosporascus sp. mg162]
MSTDVHPYGDIARSIHIFLYGGGLPSTHSTGVAGGVDCVTSTFVPGYSFNQRTDAQDPAFNLLSSLQILPAARHLRSKTGYGTFRSDLLRLNSAVDADDFDFDRIKPLLNAILADKPDKEIWDAVYDAVTESTPPPRPIASSLQQTP